MKYHDYFPLDKIPNELLWGHRQRIQDAFQEHDEGQVWLQHVPYDPVIDRQSLYKLRDQSGLSPQEFYLHHFGRSDPGADRLEVGEKTGLLVDNLVNKLVNKKDAT